MPTHFIFVRRITFASERRQAWRGWSLARSDGSAAAAGAAAISSIVGGGTDAGRSVAPALPCRRPRRRFLGAACCCCTRTAPDRSRQRSDMPRLYLCRSSRIFESQWTGAPRPGAPRTRIPEPRSPVASCLRTCTAKPRPVAGMIARWSTKRVASCERATG